MSILLASWLGYQLCFMFNCQSANDFRSWLNHVLSSGKGWNTFLSSICKQSDPISGDIAHVNVAEIMPSSFACNLCDAVFLSIAALCTHNFRCHGYRNPARYFIKSNTCAACLTKFHHRDDVFRHLAYYRSKGCLQLLQRIYLPMSHGTVCELDDVAVVSKLDRAASRCPCTPPCKELGPLLHVDILDVRRRQLYQFE